MLYTFNKANKGCYGDAFEALLRYLFDKYNGYRATAGKTDLRLMRKNIEIKTNGGIIKYASFSKFFHGSGTIIYTTHIVFDVIAEDENTCTIEIDLDATEFFVLDRKAFLAYLTETNGYKHNTERKEINVQTMWNYKKNAYHGARGKKLEAWARENECDPLHIKDMILTAYHNQ